MKAVVGHLLGMAAEKSQYNSNATKPRLKSILRAITHSRHSTQSLTNHQEFIFIGRPKTLSAPVPAPIARAALLEVQVAEIQKDDIMTAYPAVCVFSNCFYFQPFPPLLFVQFVCIDWKLERVQVSPRDASTSHASSRNVIAFNYTLPIKSRESRTHGKFICPLIETRR